MRNILGALVGLLLIGSSSMMALAQDSSPVASGDAGETTVFSEGFDAPATYFSERGDPLATVTVTGIERGWDQYGRYNAPDPGIEYVAVTFEIENLSRGNMIIKPRDFTVMDHFGRNNDHSWVRPDEDSGVTIFRDDEAIASGETIEQTIVFELYETTEIDVFTWQPERDVTVMVDLREI